MSQTDVLVADAKVSTDIKTLPAFDVESLRKDFPILTQSVHGKPLVYLDNAATSQKPTFVLDNLEHYYRAENSNVHRGVHRLSEIATEAFEASRKKVQRFLGAASEKEIIFTRGTTEGINLVASSYGRKFLTAGDEVVISAMEHHSNIVPWQMLCEATGAVLRVIPINDDGELLIEKYRELLMSGRVKLVSFVHVSNSLGTVNPAKEIIDLAHRAGAVVLVDGAQAIQHFKVDVQTLDADFYVFSAHKLYGPTGVGILYGKAALLNAMPPYQGGGDMIRTVSFEKTTYNDLPYKFEAGTPDISGAIAFGAAIDYVERLGVESIAAHEAELLRYATEQFAEIKEARIIGTAKEKVSVLSFVLENIHPHDVGTLVDREGVAIRTGHHCTQPVMTRFGLPATSRASFAMYNTKEEVDALVRAVKKTVEMFK